MILNTAYYNEGVIEKKRSKIISNFFQFRNLLEFITYLFLWNSYFFADYHVLKLMFVLLKFIQFY
jgi:hypothetical protein